MRVFVAIPLPSELKAKLATLQQEFRQSALHATWVREASFHVTLKFLGEIHPERLQAIVTSMRETAQRYRPFDVMLRGVGVFPNELRPRVLWVGLHGGVLGQLQRELEEHLALQGYPADERPYHPHLTLARVKQVRQHRDFLTCINKYRDTEVGPFTVDCLELLESQLHPTGANYSVINAAALVSRGG
jgi:2'-5' RNA ligase